MGRLQGKVAIITGAGTGVGRACMKIFAAEGAKVVGISRTQKNLDETLAEVKAAKGEGKVIAADLAKAEIRREGAGRNAEGVWPRRHSREFRRRRL